MKNLLHISYKSRCLVEGGIGVSCDSLINALIYTCRRVHFINCHNLQCLYLVCSSRRGGHSSCLSVCPSAYFVYTVYRICMKFRMGGILWTLSVINKVYYILSRPTHAQHICVYIYINNILCNVSTATCFNTSESSSGCLILLFC